MSEKEPTHSREFEADTRERLATLEAHQEKLQDTVEDVADSQDEILDRLDGFGENYATEEQIRDIEEQTQENTISRERKQAIIQAVISTVTVAGGLGAYVTFFT